MKLCWNIEQIQEKSNWFKASKTERISYQIKSYVMQVFNLGLIFTTKRIGHVSFKVNKRINSPILTPKTYNVCVCCKFWDQIWAKIW